MARIPYVDPAEAPEKVAELLNKGLNLNVTRMLAHAAPEFRRFQSFANALLTKSDIDKWLLELAILRVGHLCKAPYEIQQHEKLARDLGATPEQLAAIPIGASSPVFNEHEKLILRYTDDVVQNVRASDATFKPLLERHSHQGLVELTLTIGFYMMVSRFLNTFDVDLEIGETPIRIER